MIAVILPAAGDSSRMRGRDKLLEDVDGEPLIRRQARAALEAGDAIVALPPDRPERRAALAGLDVRCVAVADAAEGMGASIRACAAALPARATAALVLPADMPDVTGRELRLFRDRHAEAPGLVLRGATRDLAPGHPVLFPRRLFAGLRRLAGDEGARGLLRGEEVELVPLPGAAARADLDTPEDWAAWRAGR